MPHAEVLNPNPGRSPRRVQGVEPYLEKVERALATEVCPQRRKMLDHLRANTLVHFFKPDCHKQTAAMKGLIEDVTTGKFTDFKAFSKEGLLPYVQAFHKTPAKKQPTAQELYERRQMLEEKATSQLFSSRKPTPKLSIAATKRPRGIHTSATRQ